MILDRQPLLHLRNRIRALGRFAFAFASLIVLKGQTPTPVPKTVIPSQVSKPTSPSPPSVPPIASPRTVAPPKAQAAKETGVVSTVLRMVKLKLSETTILKTVQPLLNGRALSPDEVIRLAEGGATPSLIDALSAQVGNAGTALSTKATTTSPRASTSASAAPINAALTGVLTDLSTLACEKPAALRKRVIAVSEFDFGAQKSTEQALLQTQNAIGTGMTALAVKRIQETGKFRIVERKGLESIKLEQELGNSTRAKQGTSARFGRIQGADALLMGTITVFGRDDRNKSVGAGGVAPGILGRVSFGSKEDKAVVAVSYRLVDAETSEVISSGEARGESLRKSKGLSLAAANGKGGGAGGYDMTSSNFQETIIGEATVDCMNKLIAILNSNESKIRLRQIELDTRIADVSGKQIYISSGSAEGVQVCDRFEVSSIIKEVRDPVTKEVLDLQLEKVGEILVTEARDKMAVAAFQGVRMPEVGMVVRKILSQPTSTGNPVVMQIEGSTLKPLNP